MATIQQKTHQILGKQKQEYTRMVKDAFKGKSNLSQKQVQSTIKKVAQEYREKYGATPRKRYLSAVKQASAQKPTTAKPTKQAKPKTTLKRAAKKSKTTEQSASVKPAYSTGTHLMRLSNKQVFKIAQVNMIANNWHYTLKEYLGKEELYVCDKDNHLAKEFKRISEREGYSIWKRYKAKADRKEAYSSSKEAERKRKQEHKELVKKNPEWIKTVAEKTGLTEHTIEALYHACAKDEIRPVMNGIYFGEGEIVATNAHILIAVKAKVPANMQGKVYAPSGKDIQGKYPSYKDLLLHSNGKHYVANCFRGRPEQQYVSVEFDPVKTHKLAASDTFSIKDTKLKVELYRKIHKVFVAQREAPPACWRSNGRKYNAKDYPICFVSKSVSAIQMPMLVN